MKCFQYFLVLILAFEAKGDPEIRPFQAEQNFRLLKKTMETSEDSKIFLDEGSGDYEDDDDYYDEEDYYEDYEGSGLLKTTEIEKKPVKVTPDSDFHFEEKTTEADDDLLYEYYNEIYEGDLDDDYIKELEQDLEEKVPIETHSADKKNWILQPSYIFLMLSSALISFAVFILAFILCRRSALEKQKKQNLVPFVVSSRDFSLSTPIVKNYQRVPTSTKELITKNPVEKPLLT